MPYVCESLIVEQEENWWLSSTPTSRMPNAPT